MCEPGWVQGSIVFETPGCDTPDWALTLLLSYGALYLAVACGSLRAITAEDFKRPLNLRGQVLLTNWASSSALGASLLLLYLDGHSLLQGLFLGLGTSLTFSRDILLLWYG